MADENQDTTALYVELVGGQADGRRHRVGRDGLLVGRSDTCDVMLTTHGLSRRHAYFYADGERCFVEDLGSTNGVEVNGRPVKKAEIHEGDLIDLGPVRFVLRAVEQPEDARALPEPETPSGPSEPGWQPISRYPLAVAALIFGAMAYQYWAFGLGAVVLALFSLREMREKGEQAGRGLAYGALVIGLVGGLLNVWYGELQPRIAARAERTPTAERGERSDRSGPHPGQTAANARRD